jgi:ArsR family transcriptional regulator
VGIDNSPEMLAIARDRLERAGAGHCQVRLGDIYRLPFRSGGSETGFDVALFHQVLHYLEEPQSAVTEVARVLRRSGRLLIADFAPHDVEFLRTELSHRRLGFSDREVESWFTSAGLEPEMVEAVVPSDVVSQRAQLTVKIWTARVPGVRARIAA